MVYGFALAAVLAAGPALAAGTTTHSGRVTAIDPQHHTITLEEVGPWTGPGTGVIARSIIVTPPGGYVTSSMPVVELRPGDFATATTARHGREMTATSIEVVRPVGA
jgi:hypothetical protein